MSYVRTRVENFLGFEFLVRNEEIDGHSHEERGIFEESFSPIFTYIFSYICKESYSTANEGKRQFNRFIIYYLNIVSMVNDSF